MSAVAVRPPEVATRAVMLASRTPWWWRDGT